MRDRAGRPIALAVARRALGVWRAAPLAVLGIALLAGALPGALVFALALAFAVGGLAGSDPERVGSAGAAAAFALWGLATALQVGATTAGAIRAARGERFGARAALGAGLRRAPAVLVAGTAAAAAAIAGAGAFLLPGALALAALCAAVPAAVEERAGPFRALARSLELTRGARVGLVAPVGGAAFAAFAGAWAPLAWPAVPASIESSPALVFALPLWQALFVPLPAVAAAAAYAELRERRDPPRAAELERVFG